MHGENLKLPEIRAFSISFVLLTIQYSKGI